jgi:hypothetical protein
MLSEQICDLKINKKDKGKISRKIQMIKKQEGVMNISVCKWGKQHQNKSILT